MNLLIIPAADRARTRGGQRCGCGGHELLQFLSDWLSRDHDHLGVSLAGFVGNRTYNPRQLRDDLNRFIFLARSKIGSAW